jgi:hypothetical protein
LAIALSSLRTDAANIELFRVERNTNANYVRYDARVQADGTLDPKSPITAYWILPAERGKREGLTWLEEKLAYGFSVSRRDDGFSVTLIAFDRRRVAIRRSATSWRAEVQIAGHRAVLRRIWVQVADSLLGPHVEWVELTGLDERSNQVVSERIANQ